MAEKFLSAVKGLQPQRPRETISYVEYNPQQPREFPSAVEGLQPQGPRETLSAIEGYTQQLRGFLLAVKKTLCGQEESFRPLVLFF
jgi:hypothetical protein